MASNWRLDAPRNALYRFVFFGPSLKFFYTQPKLSPGAFCERRNYELLDGCSWTIINCFLFCGYQAAREAAQMAAARVLFAQGKFPNASVT